MAFFDFLISVILVLLIFCAAALCFPVFVFLGTLTIIYAIIEWIVNKLFH